MNITTIDKIRVMNMNSPRTGNKVANQFIVETEDGVYFQSYNSVIAFRNHQGIVTLDPRYWDYSRTTLKYLGEFLEGHDFGRLHKREIEYKIKTGNFQTANLN